MFLICLVIQLDDVAAAVLYEETATILPARRAMLYLVLASRRYELSGQRLLSTQSLRRCEGGAGWTGIADYVDEVLGRQAGNEGNWLTAAEHCWQLIQRRLSNNGDGNADVGHLEDLRAAFEVRYRPCFAMPNHAPPYATYLRFFFLKRPWIHLTEKHWIRTTLLGAWLTSNRPKFEYLSVNATEKSFTRIPSRGNSSQKRYHQTVYC